MMGYGMVAVLLGLAGAAADGVEVEVEEVVARVEEANNGAGPLWCYGAPLIVREGGEVFASVMEVGQGVPPPCNTRWRLFRRGPSGWSRIANPAGFPEREPCPLARAGPLGLLLSINPSAEPPGGMSARSDPHLLRFDAGAADRPPVPLRPVWAAGSRFAPHSYRGLASDPSRGEALALNIDAATNAQRWSLLTPDGRTARSGEIRFPIRACYPQVALRGGAGHVLALGDVVEPIAAWREHKRAKTGAAWDYVFRRLFYATAPDLAAADFGPPLEIDSVEATGGDLRNLDLHLGPAGAAHLLYLRTNIAAAIRDEFFPGRQIVTSLEHVVVERGEVRRRSTILMGGEGRPETPRYARFHATADGSLLIVAAVAVAPGRTAAGLEDRIIPVMPDGQPAPATRLELASPLTTFFTATERGGNLPSDTLDLFGQASTSSDLRYARVRIR